MLDLGQRANQLFKSANPLQQQQILKGLVYNVEMFDQKLSYSLINCYEAFKQLNETAQSELNDTTWCHAVYTLRTKYYDVIIKVAKEVEIAKQYLNRNEVYMSV